VIGENLRFALGDFWAEFRKNRAGMVGLALVILFLAAVILEPRIIPFPKAGATWHDITAWDDNPPSAPPQWINRFTEKKAAITSVVTQYEKTSEQSDSSTLVTYTFSYQDPYDVPPLDLIVHFVAAGDVPFAVSVVRPDREEVPLYQEQRQAGTREDVRVSMDRNSASALFDYLKGYESEDTLSSVDPGQLKPVQILFSVAEPGMLKHPRPLKGMYQVKLQGLLLSDASALDNPYVVFTGRVSGLLGTDNSKRDLWSGLVAGVKWALLIGVLTSFIAVAVGVVYGIVEAYFGGLVNAILQRIWEVMVNMPLLPILIVLSAVFKPSIWFLIVIMSAFFWVGPVKTVYSMALQIKEETYIEATRALGAGHGRIIFRHMVPILVPYSFASMALSVPAAVVYEATVSLLGLGDASIVTWGQILHDAFSGGAVLNGLWWWVVPPGLMIAVMGMTFSFVGFAMDTILHPKLRTR
ncbi:MAG TPA: ABC transporter permease, partial [Spirochaetia bacterium]|nr:ABC transporter permease [Spirochaetia bacterium]